MLIAALAAAPLLEAAALSPIASDAPAPVVEAPVVEAPAVEASAVETLAEEERGAPVEPTAGCERCAKIGCSGVGIGLLRGEPLSYAPNRAADAVRGSEISLVAGRGVSPGLPPPKPRSSL